MSDDAHPQPLASGQVYFATDQAFGAIKPGTAALLVRVEQRPREDEPEAYLTWAHDGTVFTRHEPMSLFWERWALSYTPPGELAQAYQDSTKLHAFVQVFQGVESLVLERAMSEGDLDMRKAGEVGRSVYGTLRERWKEAWLAECVERAMGRRRARLEAGE